MLRSTLGRESSAAGEQEAPLSQQEREGSNRASRPASQQCKAADSKFLDRYIESSRYKKYFEEDKRQAENEKRYDAERAAKAATDEDKQIFKEQKNDEPESVESTSTFLGQSKEFIYETSGLAPSITECYSKQLTKNSPAVLCKVGKPAEYREASPTIDLLKVNTEQQKMKLT